jgi:hypothetical protein
VFPNEVGAASLATEISLGSSEQWTLKRYLTIDGLEAVSDQTRNFRDIDLQSTACSRKPLIVRVRCCDQHPY